MEKWYMRPVVFVTDMAQALDFYIKQLGFVSAWEFKEEERITVAQVTRGDCEIILAIDGDRAGMARLYISLEEEEMTVFREDIEVRSIPVKQTWWGNPVLLITDPDDNQILFPFEE